MFVLLTLAALMRPEAWLLIGLYWLWFVWPRTTTWRTRDPCSAGSRPSVP